MSLKGRGALNAISRELGWRRIQQGWWYSVGHIRAEENDIADVLSRTSAPHGSERRARPEGVETLPRLRPRMTSADWETIL